MSHRVSRSVRWRPLSLSYKLRGSLVRSLFAARLLTRMDEDGNYCYVDVFNALYLLVYTLVLGTDAKQLHRQHFG